MNRLKHTMTTDSGQKRWSEKQLKKESSPLFSTSPSQAKIIEPCDSCDNKELCPVYMGQNCLLVKEHKEELQAKF